MAQIRAPRRSARRAGAAVAAPLLAVFAAGCGGSSGSPATHASDHAGTTPAPTATSTPAVPSAPHYASVKIGGQPYVNACAAYYGHRGKVYSTFDKYTLDNAVFQETYAENPLPASWYTSPEEKVSSSCSVQFADPPWADSSVIFTVDQYGSPALAKAAFSQDSPITQASLNKVNKEFGTHWLLPTANFSKISGVASTYYQKSSGASDTLAGDKIIGFNLGTLRPDKANRAVLRKAIPRALKTVALPGQSAVVGSRDFGKRIGASHYGNPCQVFTAGVFHQATGLTADPTSVSLVFNGNAVSHPRPVQYEGIADNQCRRESLLIGKGRSADLTVELHYFDSAAQTRHWFGVRKRKDRKQVHPAPGMGHDAYLFKFAGQTSLNVAHGPYMIEISGDASAYGQELKDAPLSMLKAALAATLTNLR
jgi:hypothetical protein